MLEPFSPLQLAAGLTLYVLPGITWTVALTPTLSWAERAPVMLVAAFTIMPACLFVLHVLFDVPIALAPAAFLSATLGIFGAAWWLRGFIPQELPQASPGRSRPATKR